MKEQAIAGNLKADQLPEEPGVMTLSDHINELRKRLVRAVIALGLGVVIVFIFIERIMFALVSLAGQYTPQALKPTEMFVTYMKVAFICGLALALPFILYELLAFLAPGLRPVERKYIFFAVPFVTIAFAIGIVFGYMLVVPRALDFLLGFGSTMVEVRPSIEYLVGFVTTFLFWIGITFETPILIFFVTKIGIVSRERLAKFRRYAFLVILVIAAIITPTPDPVNMMIVAVPMYLLYELGLVLARFA